MTVEQFEKADKLMNEIKNLEGARNSVVHQTLLIGGWTAENLLGKPSAEFLRATEIDLIERLLRQKLEELAKT